MVLIMFMSASGRISGGGCAGRVGQKNKITRRWALRGTRPIAPHDQRTQSTYIFGAISARCRFIVIYDRHSQRRHISRDPPAAAACRACASGRAPVLCYLHHVPNLPPPHHRLGLARRAHNLCGTAAVGRGENNLSNRLKPMAISRQSGLRALPLIHLNDRRQCDRRCQTHPARMQ